MGYLNKAPVSIERILIIISLIGLMIIFINGFYIQRQTFRREIGGIVKEKTNGSKGSITLIIYKSSSEIVRFPVTLSSTSGEQAIQMMDSIAKRPYSYFINLYKKNQTKYEFYDSIEISHW